MAYFGVQYRGPQPPQAAVDAVAQLRAACAESTGPAHRDVAEFVDQAGFTTKLNVLYWLDSKAYDTWNAQFPGWTDPARYSDDVGYFLEIAAPSADRFETIFGSRKLSRTEGISEVAEAMSDEIEEHGYWGSARDRMPAAQTSELQPEGDLRVERDGELSIVRSHQNMCLIRSGQDWTDTIDAARERYCDRLQPVLIEGMNFLRDDGLDAGCYSNRYVTVTDDDGAPLCRTYGLGWWRSLADLEQWSASHPTHLEIFGGFGRYLREFKGAAGLRLYHEVTVLSDDQCRFEYLGCHNQTGLLAAVG